jgi:peptidoglycan/LPS O-acetylase OafA/YrhL
MKKRIVGFDLLRFYAVIVVIFKHSTILLPKFLSDLFIFLPDSVDLFFVLSGFLIGNLFIRDFLTDKQKYQINFNSILLFIKKRWFRTLPNYYLFFLINIALIYFNFIPGTLNKYSFTYLFFCQNLFLQFDFLFWESWSLAVEEWFYVLFPFLFLFLFKIKKLNIKIYYLVVCLLLICVSVIYKFYALQMNLDFDLYIRKVVLSRFDTIAVGLLSAYIYNFYNKIWNLNTPFLFIIGILSYLLIKHCQVNSMIVYTVNTLSIALILPLVMKITLPKVISKIVTFFANSSYSAYLIHLILLHIILHFFNNILADYKPLLLILYLFLIFFLSNLIFKYFETPILNYRNKTLN